MAKCAKTSSAQSSVVWDDDDKVDWLYTTTIHTMRTYWRLDGRLAGGTL